MAQTSAAVEKRSAFVADFERSMPGPRPDGLFARMYRDIGLAIVADALEISTSDLDFEHAEAIRRGARYLLLMPKPKIRLPNIPAHALAL
jgi:hypothetical protein